MSRTKFTPGPWIVRPGCIVVNSVPNPNGPGVYEYVVSQCGQFKPPIATANAHLIAAAPELYAEVETLIGCLESGTEMPEDLECILSYAKQVLAKARGES